jgi:hypothetical protein
MTKAEKIKLSLNQTRQKRKHQRPIFLHEKTMAA